MVWGAISSDGPEKLVWLNEDTSFKLNKETYREIIEEHIFDIDYINN